MDKISCKINIFPLTQPYEQDINILNQERAYGIFHNLLIDQLQD